MSAKPNNLSRGLGRSFASLIPSELLDESFDPTAAQDEQVSELRNIKLTEIDTDPGQPRRHFDEAALDEMVLSIQEHGILQPIVVTPRSGRYVIVAGERRFRASQRAGLTKIPALVRTLTDQHRLELSLIENLQRRDLNPLETATAYLKLRDQFNLTLDEIGHRIGGKAVSSVSNTLRLLRLPPVVKQAMIEGRLSEGQARPLIGLDEALVKEVLPQIIREEWSARRVEQFIVQLKRAQRTPGDPKTKVVSSVAYEEETKRIADYLHAKVTIKSSARGSGSITISFANERDLERLQALLADKS